MRSNSPAAAPILKVLHITELAESILVFLHPQDVLKAARTCKARVPNRLTQLLLTPSKAFSATIKVSPHLQRKLLWQTPEQNPSLRLTVSGILHLTGCRAQKYLQDTLNGAVLCPVRRRYIPPPDKIICFLNPHLLAPWSARSTELVFDHPSTYRDAEKASAYPPPVYRANIIAHLDYNLATNATDELRAMQICRPPIRRIAFVKQCFGCCRPGLVCRHENNTREPRYEAANGCGVTFGDVIDALDGETFYGVVGEDEISIGSAELALYPN